MHDESDEPSVAQGVQSHTYWFEWFWWSVPLQQRELRRLIGLKQRDGYTLVPLSLYFKNGRVKLELALAKGKKLYDKRHSIAERDANRRIQKSIRRV